VLENKRATVAKTEIETLESKKAKYTGSGVTVDGNIITGSSPEYSKRLVQEIIGRLGGYDWNDR
jgi:putative intracellular protease/amidase